MNTNMIFAQESYDNVTDFIADEVNPTMVADTVHTQKNASHSEVPIPGDDVVMQQRTLEAAGADKTYLFTNYEENVAQQLRAVNGEEAGDIVEGKGVVLA